MRLNIGSHNKKLDGYKNVDILPLDGVDFQCDITKTPWRLYDLEALRQVNVGWTEDSAKVTLNAPEFSRPVQDDSIESIVMIEVLEHISWRDTNRVLREIHRILEPGGTIHIQVPDCGAMMYMHCSGQVGEEMPHKIGEEDALKIIAQRKEEGLPTVLVNPTRWLMAFCGAQKHPYDAHLNVFTKERMEEALEDVGFARYEFKEDPLHWKIKVTATK